MYLLIQEINPQAVLLDTIKGNIVICSSKFLIVLVFSNFLNECTKDINA